MDYLKIIYDFGGAAVDNDIKHFEKEFRRYFSDIQFRMGIYDKAKKEMDIHLASEFNVFEYINPNENGLSDIFADLLDPKGKHGQKDMFLKSFLNIIKQKPQISSMNCKTIREDTTNYIRNNLRRIDITLNFEDGFMIGIENKPWDTEQDNQLKDYQEHLRKKHGENWCLVYVSGDGSEPVSIRKKLKEQLVETGQLIVLSYEDDIIKWLTECYKECKAERVRIFIQDFIKYIEENFENVSDCMEGTDDEK